MLIHKYFLVIVLLFISSCGIETIKSLDAPNIDYLSQSDFTKISFVNSLSGQTDFLGYEIYYKIYSSASTAVHLTADRDYLTNYGATKEMLYNIGYHRLNLSLSQRTVEPVINVVTTNVNNSNNIITLDFYNFNNKILNSVTNDFEPVLYIKNASGTIIFSAINLYRGIQYSNSYKRFTALFGSYTSDSDFDNSIVSSTTSYEICFFISGYAWSPEGATFSQPVPLGIIRDILK